MPPSWYDNKRKAADSNGYTNGNGNNQDKSPAAAFLELYDSNSKKPKTANNSYVNPASTNVFASQSKLKRPSASASPRLSSLSEKFSFQPAANKPASTVFARYNSMLANKPTTAPTNGTSSRVARESSSSAVGLDAHEELIAKRLQGAFRTVPLKMINYAVKKQGTYDAAANWLENQNMQGSKKNTFAPSKSIATYSNGYNKANTRNVIDLEDSDDDMIVSDSEIIETVTDNEDVDDLISEATAAGFLEAKREVSKPSMSIRQKFSHRTNNNSNGSINGSSQPDVEVISSAPKRRLVRVHQVEEEDFSDDSDVVENGYDDEEEIEFNYRVLEFLNNASVNDVADISACELSVAQVMVDARPFKSLDDATEVRTESDGKSSRRKTVGEKIVDAVSVTLKGYEAVDSLIKKCEELGNQVANDMSNWGVNVLGKSGELEIVDINDDEPDSEDEVIVVRGSRNKASVPNGGFFSEKPKLLAPELELKNYQQVGINWLSLLYKRKLSCILADEMGLGKTCQVISFLAHLKEIGEQGPHLVVVPSSTLENWLREFQKFCPEFVVEPYYGSMAERAEIRDALTQPNASFDVMVTTYNLACGASQDLGFLKSRKFNVCVYDEGHMLKNSQSERYIKLMKLHAKFRLILTGTPLQNNLRELVSLLSFILPDIFNSKKEDLAGIFKHKAKSTDKGDGRNPLLSEQRITKAKKMMTPFVLRRKKNQVLQHLPSKTHEVVYCELTGEQQVVYNRELEVSRKAMEDRKAGKKGVKSVGNVLMQLRKASLHHLLFRNLFSDKVIKQMAHEIMREEQYRNANEQYIYEDMEVMTDAELHRLCEQFPSIRRHKLVQDEWMNSGKVQKLQELLPPMKANGDRILIFSQFTQMLDILERVLNYMGITFVRLDGQTPVELRQPLIDKFYEETDITVFLLSTKAGGFGINLTCANTVIIYDLSFNPHDDKQAEDRAHRVGQTQDVRVIRLITKNTIEENILQLANTKLALDRSVSDDKEAEKADENNAQIVASQIFK